MLLKQRDQGLTGIKPLPQLRERRLNQFTRKIRLSYAELDEKVVLTRSVSYYVMIIEKVSRVFAP